MRLLRVTANVASFRTVVFNRSGLSFIVAARRHTGATNKTRTYNGVGKSLLLEIIHFCLGSEANAAFRQHLPGWIFSLAFEVQGREHIVSRGADKSSELTLDGEDLSLPKLRAWLYDETFEKAHGIQGLSFRSLIGPFLRSGRAAYARFDQTGPGDQRNDYWPLVRSTFLLGLDLFLVQRKRDLRTRQTTLAKTMKQLETDPLFSELVLEDRVGSELAELNEEVSRLDADLRDFKVAEEYQHIQSVADEAKKHLELQRRERVKVDEAIAQITRSLETRGDLDAALVARAYGEANVAFPEAVQKTLDDVLSFQRELTRKRVARLTQERQNLIVRRDFLDAEIRDRGSELDAKLRFLGSHVALTEYLAVNEKANSLKHRIAQLEAVREQRLRVDRELKTLERDLAEDAIRTDEYLESEGALIAEADTQFRRYTRALYGNRSSGISVSNDSGSNTLRYRIAAHINADAAEGINEAKIFCYDWTILGLGRRHSVQCLAHDSALFSPVDSRQRLAMLLLAEQITEERGFQYIAMLNQHDIESLAGSDAGGAEKVGRIFSDKNVVLRLTDGSPREKLLGVEIDMDYSTKGEADSDGAIQPE